MMPNQKAGIETPSSAPPMATLSVMEPRLTAEMMPSGMEMSRTRMMAARRATMVAGRRDRISWLTGDRVEIELPMSPRSRLRR